MKKLVMLSILALCVLSTSAFATETRTLTLGQTNNVLLDEANIWLYPSRIMDYPNLAIGEFGYDPDSDPIESSSPADFTRFGVHFKIGRDNPWVLGAYFDNLPASEPENLFDDGNLVEFDTLFDDGWNNRRINLFYGNSLGNINFGARLGLLHSSVSADMTDNEAKEGFSYYDLTLGLTAPDGGWDVAGNIALGSFTDDNEDGDAENEKDGFYDLSLQGRFFYQVNPSYTIIPHAGLAYSKRGIVNYTNDDDVDSEDYSISTSRTGLQLGVGLNYTPATNVLAVADFGLGYNKVKEEFDTTDTYVTDPDLPEYTERNKTDVWLPYFKLGLDADVFKWLDIRMGAVSIWNRQSDETKLAEDVKYKANYADNSAYLGFGFHWGRFHVDAWTDPELFLNGFNFLSGADSGEMNFQLSAVYEMM
ncbi:MAG TPA: hypothetical protein PKW75_00800 [candidate division Zixibacteria bacterium]|nr:hypothetical protein [candidate division Zixibacteria bacterium]MDD4916460.1 hypothetical protein [candidate division Zixibacteria bacterium]MDM7972883.1 hypothetical protein [candidate division Zixibacteria bacterium]HOD65115.1 hypothetical protein [candidate division Zixibacteria bacterium]HOZ06798.1 hypothetical protein [candidate division Zixibacteria bacterium]